MISKPEAPFIVQQEPYETYNIQTKLKIKERKQNSFLIYQFLALFPSLY